MADIFLSYAREDEAKIKGLVAVLEAEGWSVFWDRRIPTGETWRGFIGSALESARCVIVAWSRHSIESQWVAEEADEGKARRILLPIMLDPVQPPRGFWEIQTADLSAWQPGQPSESFSSLAADVRRLLAKQAPAVHVDTGSSSAVEAASAPQVNSRPFDARRWVLIGLAVALIAGVAWYWFVPLPVDPTADVALPSRPLAPDRQLEPKVPRRPLGPVESGRGSEQMEGAWVIVTASFKRFERQRAEDQLAALGREGIVATILDSNEYPLLTPDLWVVAVGPFASKQEANTALGRIKARVQDAYVKKGK